MPSKIELKWRPMHGQGPVVHLGAEERGMRTSCGVVLNPLNGPLMGDDVEEVNCLRCTRSSDMNWAKLAAVAKKKQEVQR